MIRLDLRQDLKKVREAFDKGELQAQTQYRSGKGCFYSGPCAIGVMMDPEVRPNLDRYGFIGGLVDINLVDLPWDQIRDAVRLQDVHDACVRGAGTLAAFQQVLTELEAKYA